MQAGKGEVVEEMGQLLERAGMRDVLPLPKARVPVVKFVVNDTNTKVEATPSCDTDCGYIPFGAWQDDLDEHQFWCLQALTASMTKLALVRELAL